MDYAAADTGLGDSSAFLRRIIRIALAASFKGNVRLENHKQLYLERPADKSEDMLFYDD